MYLRMRMKLVVSLWPHIQAALNSPWSNIRSICYGLICSMLKIEVADYPQEEAEKISPHLSYDEIDSVHITQQKLSSIVLWRSLIGEIKLRNRITTVESSQVFSFFNYLL